MDGFRVIIFDARISPRLGGVFGRTIRIAEGEGEMRRRSVGKLILFEEMEPLDRASLTREEGPGQALLFV